MKLLFVPVLVPTVALLLAGCLGAAPDDTQAAPGVAATCNTCHQGKRSFAGRDAQELAEAIRAIRDGELQHPSLGLVDDKDAAIDALAEQLVSN